MSIRHALFAALSAVTLAVAPATAETMSSEELTMPLTRVSELSQPISTSKPQETEEQFPKVSSLEEEIEGAKINQTQQLEVVQEGTSKERSPTESEIVEPVQIEPTRVTESQPILEPSPVVEQAILAPSLVETNYRFDSQVKLESFQVEPSQPTLEPTRVVQTQIQEPSPNIEQKPIVRNNVVPFNAKGRLLNQDEPTRVTQQQTSANNIVPFRQRVVNQVESSQPLLQTGGNTGVTTLETPVSLSREFGTSYPGFTPETTYGLDHEFSIPVFETPTTRTRKQNVVEGNDTSNVRTVSTRASDLGGTVTVQPNPPVVVETQEEAKPETETQPQVSGSLSVGVSGIGGNAPVLETAVGIEYDGFNLTGTLNHPLDGIGEDTVGLVATLPISERASLTLKADEINIDPVFGISVESRISDRLTASMSLSINRPDDFNAELAAKYEINQHWSTNASFNVTTRQLNLGAKYTGRGFDVGVGVDDIAENPRVGATLGLELSASTRLELSGSNLTTDPTLGVKVGFSF
jgi:hypothetical protein